MIHISSTLLVIALSMIRQGRQMCAYSGLNVAQLPNELSNLADLLSSVDIRANLILPVRACLGAPHASSRVSPLIIESAARNPIEN